MRNELKESLLYGERNVISGGKSRENHAEITAAE